MSSTSFVDEFDRLSADIDAGIDRIARAAGSDDDPGAVAEELRDIVDEIQDLFGTIDLNQLPDAIAIEELPNVVDEDAIPEAIATADPKLVLDLGNVHRIIEFRELAHAVDIVEFWKEKRELDVEIDDITGDESERSADARDEDEGTAELDAVIETAVVQRQVLEAMTSLRKEFAVAHGKLRGVYRHNQETLGQSRRRRSRNPTARSTLPPGPLDATVAGRSSTVPAQVRYATVRTPPRIYGRRFDRLDRRRD